MTPNRQRWVGVCYPVSSVVKTGWCRATGRTRGRRRKPEVGVSEERKSDPTEEGESGIRNIGDAWALPRISRRNSAWFWLLDVRSLANSPDRSRLVQEAGFEFDDVQQYYLEGQPKFGGFVTRGVARAAA
jgi:hypothetical protein